MTKRKPKKRTRTSPREASEEGMRALGYVTPEEACQIGRATGATTAHGWVRRGVLKPVAGYAPFVRTNGVLWILAESVRRYRPDPEDLARAR